MIGKEILNYKIISLIGTGGMGSVYLAEHTLISEQKVAIKVINANMVNDFTRDLLKKEAKRLATLNNQNIVTFHNYHIDNEGNVYLVMEYAEGRSLDDYINNINGLIVEERICPVFEPILDAVGYAHKKGILHRDIKPANIIIGEDNTPKILDFGIAQIIKDNGEGEEEETFIMGTPSYMSPEQVKGEKLDERSDIYSLGVLLFQMLTGSAPYDTTTLTEHEINSKVIEEPLPRMKSYYKYISDKVQAVVDKATAKDPKDRYKNTDEFKKALHNAIYPSKTKKWVKIAAAATAVIVLVAGYFIWDYNRVKTYYYKDYTEQWGIPVGIGKLSSNEKISRCYRFQYQRGKLLSVAHVNSYGKVIEDNESERRERPVDQEFHYTDNGKIHKVLVKDTNGKVLYVKSYNEKLNAMTYQYDDEYGTERFLSNTTVGYGDLFGDRSATQNKGRVSRLWLEYDDNGYVITERYAGLDNTPVGDADHIYGKRYIRDQKGRVVEIQYIGKDGQPQPTKWGLGIKTFTYDGDDNWVKSEYLTVDRTPSLDDKDGVAMYVLEYDADGNVIYQLHKDSEGYMMYQKKNGIAGVHNYYNDRGQVIQQDYLDYDRQPMFVTQSGHATEKYKYDDNGFLNEVSFYDVEGNPIENNEGITTIKVTNDDKGNFLEYWVYGIDGNITMPKNGVAGTKYEYDDKGNILKVVYYDADKFPTNEYMGTYGNIYQYNDKNQIISICSLDKDLQVAPGLNGVTYIKYDYDNRGNNIRMSYYDVDGEKLINSGYGYAVAYSVFDETGNNVENGFLNADNRAVIPFGQGSAKIIYTYDENGNRNSARYYDASNRLTLVDINDEDYDIALSSVAGYNLKYDNNGNIVEVIGIGTDGSKIPNRLDIRYVYDNYGNKVECSYYLNDKPTNNTHGYQTTKYKYNSNNKPVEQAFYDKNGHLVVSLVDGFAIQRTEYDDKGNIVKVSEFGDDYRPCVNDENWSSIEFEYDNYGNPVKISYFGANGKPTRADLCIPVVITKFDKSGNMTYYAMQNERGEFYTGDDGWSISRMEYDSKNNKIAESYYDSSNRAVNTASGGYHKVKNKYDSANNLTETSYWNKNGGKATYDNVHIIVNKYNDRGNIIDVASYDVNSKPVDNGSGYQHVIIRYNEDGTVATTRLYYRSDGALVMQEDWDGQNWISRNAATPWLDELNNLQPYLPMDMEWCVIKKMEAVSPNECKVTLSVSKSLNDLSSSEIEDLKLAVTDLLDTLNDMFGHQPVITCNLYDRNHDLIYSAYI